MNKNNPFEHYQQLLGRIDEKFNEIVERHPTQFACSRGCFGCCRSGITVTNIEAAHMTSWLKNHEDTVDAIRDLAHDKPHGPEFCEFLDRDGSCLIYEVRPVVCRSHGAPILLPKEDGGELEADVCPLNFSEMDITQLNTPDWIRVDTLNMILVRLDLQYDESRAGLRKNLNLDGLLE